MSSFPPTPFSRVMVTPPSVTSSGDQPLGPYPSQTLLNAEVSGHASLSPSTASSPSTTPYTARSGVLRAVPSASSLQSPCSALFSEWALVSILSHDCHFQGPMFFELTNDECGRIRTTDLRDNQYYKEYYVTFGYLIALLLIPWTVMIILNIFVVKAVHKAYKIRRSMQGGKNNQEEKDRRWVAIQRDHSFWEHCESGQ